MARLIKNVMTGTLGVELSTVFEDSTKEVRRFKVGDIVENLRYVNNEEIVTVTGKIVNITYSMTSNLKWDPEHPTDSLAEDMTLSNIIIKPEISDDTVAVPLIEVLEFEEDINDGLEVSRMEFKPFITYEMNMYYSDRSATNVTIENGAKFHNVRIMDPANIGTDFTGDYEVIGFGYEVINGSISINGVALRNIETNDTLVTELKYILRLNGPDKFELASADEIVTVVENLKTNDVIKIVGVVETIGKPININKENVKIVMNDAVITDGSDTSGIRIKEGSATISGNALLVNNTAYDAFHEKGVLSVEKNGTVTFNGSGVSAVIADDTVNKGQFGIRVYDNGKVIVNKGTFEAGWYCISGIETDSDSVIEINGGTFNSAVDYAIYQPHAGELVINGGEISGASGAIAVNNGIVEINGGTFTVLGNGNTGNFEDVTSGLVGNVAINLNAKYGNVVCLITGGTFIARAENTSLIRVGTAHTVDLKITGGKFTSKPDAAWIATGYKVSDTADANGFYTVSANQ